MRIFNVKQGTPEWLNMRKGVITGTRLKAISSAPSTATYKTILSELIAEDLAPLPEMFQNDAMIRGTIMEPIARGEYEKLTGQKVHEVGFCLHETENYLGLSPDGFIMTTEGEHTPEAIGVYTKGIEIKCPGAKNHLEYIRLNKIPADYKWQIVNYYLINESLQELDFITYNPDIYEEHLRMHIIPTKRSDYEKELSEIWEKIQAFKVLWESEIKALLSKKDKKANIS